VLEHVDPCGDLKDEREVFHVSIIGGFGEGAKYG
jgi:hypothetical protein